MKNTTIIILLISLFTILMAQDSMNCFTVIAGKKCTLDGSVLLGHNEDDGGDRIVNMYKVPALSHSTKEKITLKNGGECPQVAKTNAYIWLEMPGFEYSDAYLNEFGVAIVSNNCPSKENQVDTTDGGIGYWLRRIMAERAKTAREAVEIGGQLVEKFGYKQSGRSYCIADPNEGWILSVVMGKHWVAQRIPDDQVMIIPNYYVIKEVNLSDKKNFMASDSLIEYATSRGWYNPQRDGNFNFRNVYGKKKVMEHPGNINRKWSGLRLLSNEEFNLEEDFPFSITPDRKLDLPDIFALLRNHYENTILEDRDQTASPHHNKNRSICSSATQYGFVAQLRRNVPRELAGIMWYSPIQPCLHPFVPIYFNISKFPEAFAYKDHKTALKLHFHENYSELQSSFEDHAFVSFKNLSSWINEDYYNRAPEVISSFSQFEKENMENHFHFDFKLQEEFQKNPRKAQQMLDQYSVKNLQMLISLLHD